MGHSYVEDLERVHRHSYVEDLERGHRVWVTPMWRTWSVCIGCGSLLCGRPGACAYGVGHSYVEDLERVGHSYVEDLERVHRVWVTPMWRTWSVCIGCGSLLCGGPGACA